MDTILELDAGTHGVREWPGSYSRFAKGKLRERQKQIEAYQDQQAEVRRIEEDIRRTKEQARGVEVRTKSGAGADVQRRLAKKVAKKAKSRERRLEKMLDGPDIIEKPKLGWNLHLADLGRDAIMDDRTILEAEGVRAGYGEREVLCGVDLVVRGQDRVALMGENGSGKTTLLRCIAGDISHAGTLRLGPSIRMGMLSQESEGLPLDDTVLSVFRSRTSMHEDEARTYLHRFLFTGADVFKPVRALSYGQRFPSSPLPCSSCRTPTSCYWMNPPPYGCRCNGGHGARGPGSVSRPTPAGLARSLLHRASGGESGCGNRGRRLAPRRDDSGSTRSRWPYSRRVALVTV